MPSTKHKAHIQYAALGLEAIQHASTALNQADLLVAAGSTGRGVTSGQARRAMARLRMVVRRKVTKCVVLLLTVPRARMGVTRRLLVQSMIGVGCYISGVSGVKAATLERVVTSRSMDFSSVDRLLFIAHATYHHIRMSYETVSRDEHVHFS